MTFLMSVVFLLAYHVDSASGIGAGVPLLQVSWPFRKSMRFAPAWFGAMVLPAGRAKAPVVYVGDACESFVGRISVRDKIVLADRGNCSFVEKV